MRTAAALLPLLPLAYAAVHEVDVGESGLTFEPKTLTVKQGDTVIFSLYPKHNVVSGPFSKPCEPTEGDGGFYSGPFANTDNGKKKFVVNVTSEDAMYYYCGVPTHCAQGMVGGWNLPSSGDTIDSYANAAKNAKEVMPQSMKGGQLLDESAVESLTSGAAASPTASGSGSPSSSGASTTPAPSGSASGSPSASGASGTSTSSNAAVAVAGEIGGLMAAVLGAVAYLF